MKSRLGQYVFLVILALLLACGDDGPTTPSSPRSVDTPSQASYTVSETGDTILGISPSPLHLIRIRIPVRVQETAGLGGALNFVRLEALLGGQPNERSEMTASRIIAKAGSNRVAGNGRLELDLDFDLNLDDFDDLVLTFDLTDDGGNNHNFEYEPTGNVLVLLDVLELKPNAFQKARRR